MHRPQSGGLLHRFFSLPRTQPAQGTVGDVPDRDMPSPAQPTTFRCRSCPRAARLLQQGRAQAARTPANARARPRLRRGLLAKGRTSCYLTTPPRRQGPRPGKDRPQDSVVFEGG
ncbi:hypothetical protein NDU88_005368 [Pleurodeles waltl]|uniref:Uncharacterized protein n=1 Tax=Pleurodeles waltl TaxID=8319 RepID=A0AAV7QF35_PLEWA|nr:hypothetical protein NDU88_005368 [Pleurodeles waltl]